jgi:hypothetical protein
LGKYEEKTAMRAINGYLENGRFTPRDVIALPRRIQAVLVYNDATADNDKAERMAFLDRFHMLGKEAEGEELPDFPRRCRIWQ